MQVATMQQELGALQPVLAEKSAATEKLLQQVGSLAGSPVTRHAIVLRPKCAG
jgi:hypothetical protein